MSQLLRTGVILRLTLIVMMVTGLGLLPATGRNASADPPGPEAFEDGIVLVGFQAGVPDAALQAIERSAGAAHVRTVGAGTRVLQVGRGRVEIAIDTLKQHAEVRYAEPNYVLRAYDTPNDTYFGLLWGLNNTGQSVNRTTGAADADIDALQAWSLTTGTKDVVVGVVDTGVDYNHPDLAANVWNNPGGIGDCAQSTHGYNAINSTCDPMDDNHHGTHVAGTIGAAGNNGAGVVGVNWNTSIMGLKFLDSSGSGYTLDAIDAIHFAVRAKLAGVNVRAINNSWGGGGFSQALLDEINLAGANDILFVAASGNSTANVDVRPSYPCSYSASNVVCVAATTQSDGIAYFSSYGANSVHLGAPGTNIASTFPGGGYAYLDGTSMATPHVTGAAALILSAPGQGGLTVGQLKSVILNNVDPLSSLAGKTVTGGRLNVCKAIPNCATPPAPTVPGAPVLSATSTSALVHLSWTVPSDGGSTITNYKLYRTNGDVRVLLATLDAVTSYDDSTVTAGITYSYEVSAVNAVGEGALSNRVDVMPQVATAPTAPQNLTAAAAKGKGITLAWKGPASAGSSPVTGYRIYRSNVSGNETFLASVGNVTSFKDTSTARGTRYYYKVTAVNAVGESVASNEASAQAK